ncbi:hypothetical protein [Streptomyces sp. NRRL S-475]|nr:hypothetical protein [Streptomyces sp. NRRL S-475]
MTNPVQCLALIDALWIRRRLSMAEVDALSWPDFEKYVGARARR